MTRSLLIAVLTLSACTGETNTPSTQTPTGATEEPTTNTIVDIAVADPQFSTLVEAVTRLGLESTLSAGEFTVFAPTNQAFTDSGITDLSAFTDEELTGILTYHALLGSVDSSAIPARTDAFAGFTLFFDTTDGVTVNNATVTTADIQADNGIIHVIDRVLVPPTIVDAAGFAGLSSLTTAVGAADPSVATLLSSPGEFTVFAPTNQAFTDAEGVTATLDTAGLTDVLTYHVFPGLVASDAIPAKADSLLTSATGNQVTALFDTTATPVINGADIVLTDIKTTNGIVHVVDQVLVPPTIVDHAVNANLTGLLDAVGAASGDLGTTLDGVGPFTVFAPTNAAFSDVSATTAGLTPEELADVLLFHVVGDDVASSGLTNGEVPSLLTNQTLTIDLSAGVAVEDSSVTIADIHGTNGTVHVIDAVMLPPTPMP